MSSQSCNLSSEQSRDKTELPTKGSPSAQPSGGHYSRSALIFQHPICACLQSRAESTWKSRTARNPKISQHKSRSHALRAEQFFFTMPFYSNPCNQVALRENLLPHWNTEGTRDRADGCGAFLPGNSARERSAKRHRDCSEQSSQETNMFRWHEDFHKPRGSLFTAGKGPFRSSV